MRIADCSFDLSKKIVSIEIDSSKGMYKLSLPFSKLQPIPTAQNSLCSVEIDLEADAQSLLLHYADGTIYSCLIDAFLEHNGDPNYFRNLVLYKASVLLRNAMGDRRINRFALAQAADVSEAHLYRIMRTSNTSKSIDQIVKVLAALDFTLDLKLIPINKIRISTANTNNKFVYLASSKTDIREATNFRPLKISRR